MEKDIKLLIGIGILAGGSYLIYKDYQKQKASFSGKKRVPFFERLFGRKRAIQVAASQNRVPTIMNDRARMTNPTSQYEMSNPEAVKKMLDRKRDVFI